MSVRVTIALAVSWALAATAWQMAYPLPIPSQLGLLPHVSQVAKAQMSLNSDSREGENHEDADSRRH